MAHYDVNIDANCGPDASLPELFPGDTVTFAAGSEHVLFCIDSADLFGNDHYEIPPNGEITLMDATVDAMEVF